MPAAEIALRCLRRAPAAELEPRPSTAPLERGADGAALSLPLRRLRQRQFNPEATAPPRLRIRADFSVHALDDLAHDGQAHAAAVVIGRQPLEHAEQPRVGMARNADAV